MNKYTKKTNAEGTTPVSAAAAQGTAAPGPLEAEQGPAEKGLRRAGEDEASNGSDTLLPTRRDPEHLRQTTQQRQGWDSGLRPAPGTHVHAPPSFGICPPAVPPPRPSTCCQFHGVFVFIFL